MRNNKAIVFLFILVVITGAVTIYFQFLKPKTNIEEQGSEKAETKEPQLKIVNPNSKSRPYAIMINNNSAAWKNHAGLQDAYLVYEIITEGGITRMMALYKDQKTSRVGSVRSARHYFLDYALENDAIYVHFGWSPKAQNDIKSLNINNINGIYDDAGFWRDYSLNVAYEHTAYTSMEKIQAMAQQKGYRVESEKKLLLNYSASEIGVQKIEEAVPANKITIPYSRYHTTSYQYDATTKTYFRFMNELPHIDAVTKEQYHFKNIIIQKVENEAMDSYGRQDIKNIGTGDGYFITDGYAVPITWTKSTRSGQTKYRYLDGSEITVNDGNTIIQIEPENMSPTFVE